MLKASGLSALTYRVFPDDSWLSRGWCLCPEGTAVRTSAYRQTRDTRRRHVSKPLHRATPHQHLQPAASERKPPLQGVLSCKTVVYTFIVSRTEAAMGPIAYPRIPDELICSSGVWNWQGKMYVPEKSLYHCHFVYHGFHIECLGSYSGNSTAVCVTRDDSVMVQYVLGYCCTVLLTVSFWYWRCSQ
jgi:hypothetical protein